MLVLLSTPAAKELYLRPIQNLIYQLLLDLPGSSHQPRVPGPVACHPVESRRELRANHRPTTSLTFITIGHYDPVILISVTNTHGAQPSGGRQLIETGWHSSLDLTPSPPFVRRGKLTLGWGGVSSK
jgi:hypothetical protein